MKTCDAPPLRQTLRGTKELELRRAVRSGSWFEIDIFAESCWDRAGIYVYNFVYISLECLATVYFKADCVHDPGVQFGLLKVIWYL